MPTKQRESRRWWWWLGVVAAGLVAGLVRAGPAAANPSLTLTGNYNPTKIVFKGNGSKHAVVGGGVTGGSLDGQAIPNLYSLEWQRDVVVPGTYKDSLVSHTGIHNQALPNGQNAGSEGSAIDVAWAIVTIAPTIGKADTAGQAGLQALIWSLVTSKFKLNTKKTASDVVSAYNADLTLLNSARSNGSLPNYTSDVVFISPSTNGEEKSKHTKADVNQGLLGYTPSVVVVSSVPEPSTMMAAASGLAPLALVVIGRRRRRSADA